MNNQFKKHILRGHNADTQSLSFGETFNNLYSGDRDGNVFFWDLEICRPILKMEKHHSETVLKVLSCKNHFISQGREGVIKIADIERKQEVSRFFCKGLTFCQFSCDGENIISLLGCEEPRIEIRRIRDCLSEEKVNGEVEVFQTGLRKETGEIMSLFIEKNDILVGFEDGSVAIYDRRKLDSVVHVWDNLHKLNPVLSISKFRKNIYSGGSYNKIFVTESKKPRKIIKEYELKLKSGVNDLKHDGNRVIASGGWDHRVRLYDMKKHQPLTVLYHDVQTSTSVSSVDIRKRDGEDFCWNICAGFSKEKKIVFWESLSLKKKKK